MAGNATRVVLLQRPTVCGVAPRWLHRGGSVFPSLGDAPFPNPTPLSLRASHKVRDVAPTGEGSSTPAFPLLPTHSPYGRDDAVYCV